MFRRRRRRKSILGRLIFLILFFVGCYYVVDYIGEDRLDDAYHNGFEIKNYSERKIKDVTDTVSSFSIKDWISEKVRNFTR